MHAEYTRQRQHLEHSVAALRKKLSKDTEIHRMDNIRVMQVGTPCTYICSTYIECQLRDAYGDVDYKARGIQQNYIHNLTPLLLIDAQSSRQHLYVHALFDDVKLSHTLSAT